MRTKVPESEQARLVFEAYNRGFRKTYGSNSGLSFNPSQTVRIIRLIREVGLDELVARMGRYFEDNNGWLQETAYPLAYFLKYPNKYVRKVVHDKNQNRGTGEGTEEAERRREARERNWKILEQFGTGEDGLDESIREFRGKGYEKFQPDYNQKSSDQVGRYISEKPECQGHLPLRTTGSGKNSPDMRGGKSPDSKAPRICLLSQNRRHPEE